MAEIGLLVKWKWTNEQFGLLLYDHQKNHKEFGHYLIFGLDEYWQPDLTAYHIKALHLTTIGTVNGKEVPPPEPEPEEEAEETEPVIKFKR